jgi:hypothetical protein
MQHSLKQVTVEGSMVEKAAWTGVQREQKKKAKTIPFYLSRLSEFESKGVLSPF